MIDYTKLQFYSLSYGFVPYECSEIQPIFQGYVGSIYCY